jgi:hypothetical protein
LGPKNRNKIRSFIYFFILFFFFSFLVFFFCGVRKERERKEIIIIFVKWERVSYGLMRQTCERKTKTTLDGKKAKNYLNRISIFSSMLEQ